MFNHNSSQSRNSSTNRPGELVQNNRFECLNDSTSSSFHTNTRQSNRDTYDKRYRNGSRHSFRGSRFSFLAEKKAPKKTNQVDLKKTRFPALIDLKKIKKNKKEVVAPESNYMDAATYTEEQLQEIQREKEKAKQKKNFKGWVSLKNNNGSTIISTFDKNGNKKEITHNETSNTEEDYNHAEFQSKCAEAMYRNLQCIQNARDEENEILGPHSRYYNKGRLTDLTYLSDSDFEDSDDDKSDEDNVEFYSDCETY